MQQVTSLKSEYTRYGSQQCFVAHSIGAEWNEDLKSACTAILPKFNLEPWYAADRFDPTQTLRDKVVELIANSRYGIYDISSWQDKQGNWQLPRNVFIELGIAIALNRPTLLLRHSSNNNLPLSTCLEGIETAEFAGDFTLKKELENRIPQWLEVPPDRDWLNRFCLFGNRVCSHRENHPRSQQWERQTLQCHVSDGLDKKHHNYCKSECDEIRGAFEDIFSRYSDLEFSYLDDRSIVDGYQFLLCSHCQTVRSTPLAIYRISPTTSAETFISIGIAIALEKLFDYKIPKIILVRQEADLPSLLRGYEVIEAVNTHDIKQKLKVYLPKLLTDIRQTSWRSKPLPFIESAIFPNRSDLSELNTVDESLDRYEFDGVSIDVLGLPTRVSNALKRSKLNTIENISKMSQVDLLKIKGVGFTSLHQILTALQDKFNTNLPEVKNATFLFSSSGIEIDLPTKTEVSSSIEIEPERIFDLSVAHQLEYICTVGGADYINDSQATDYDAGNVGLRAVNAPVILIAGGEAKEGDDTAWLDTIKDKAAAVLLIGAAADRFANRLQSVGYSNFEIVETMANAVTRSLDLVPKYQAKIVLLSPACASFDQYNGFEYCGDDFRQLCQKID